MKKKILCLKKKISIPIKPMERHCRNYNKYLQLLLYFKHKNAMPYARQLVFTGTDEDFGWRNIVLLCLKRYCEGKLTFKNIVLSCPERCNERNVVCRNIFCSVQAKTKAGWREQLNQQKLSVVALAQISFFYTNKYFSFSRANICIFLTEMSLFFTH